MRIDHVVSQVNYLCFQNWQEEVQFLSTHVIAVSKGVGDKPAFAQSISDIDLFGKAQLHAFSDIVFFRIEDLSLSVGRIHYFSQGVSLLSHMVAISLVVLVAIM